MECSLSYWDSRWNEHGEGWSGLSWTYIGDSSEEWICTTGSAVASNWSGRCYEQISIIIIIPNFWSPLVELVESVYGRRGVEFGVHTTFKFPG